MRRFGLITGALLFLLTGFWAGRLTAPLPPPQPERAPVVEAIPQLQRQAPPPADRPTCQEQLALAVGLLEAREREREVQVREKEGTPVPFPHDLPAQYGPEGFEAAVREALEGCPEAGIELHHVDCSEYPCMAFFSQPAGTFYRGAERLSDCASWKERFKFERTEYSRLMTDEGKREYSILSPWPSDLVTDENYHKRWAVRWQQGREELTVAWGGREPTLLEQIDDQLASLREEEWEGNQKFIEALETHRQALLEAQE